MLAGRLLTGAGGSGPLCSRYIAGNTTRTYDSGKRRFLRFCEAAGLTPLPLTEVLCLFVAHLMQEHLQFTSIRTYLSSRLRPVCPIPLPLMHSHVCRMSFEGQGEPGPLALIAVSPSPPPKYSPFSIIHGLAPARHTSPPPLGSLLPWIFRLLPGGRIHSS